MVNALYPCPRRFLQTKPHHRGSGVLQEDGVAGCYIVTVIFAKFPISIPTLVFTSESAKNWMEYLESSGHKLVPNQTYASFWSTVYIFLNLFCCSRHPTCLPSGNWNFVILEESSVFAFPAANKIVVKLLRESHFRLRDLNMIAFPFVF